MINAGEYTNAAYGSASVSLVDGKLVLRWNRMTAPLTHFHYDVFRGESEEWGFDENVSFALDDEKKVRSLTLFGERFDRR
jgi:hypothetical protein